METINVWKWSVGVCTRGKNLNVYKILPECICIYLNWEGCMRSMERKVEFGYHLTFWPRIDQNSWKSYETRRGEIIFPITVHRFPKKHCFLDSYPNSHVFPSTRNILLVKMSVEEQWNDTDSGKSQVLGEKTVRLPLGPPQFPQGLDWKRTQTSIIREWLTAWAMTPPDEVRSLLKSNRTSKVLVK